jgi:DNA helicase-2/ATP-dependent DNA helicase PcrA
MANKFTEEQLTFIKHNTQDSVILTATAGSGKTSSATGRLLWLLEQGVKPSRIIFFSFTNDAVDELRNRIKNDKIHITTIHSFCLSALAKCKKFKKTADFHHFINWYKKKSNPGPKARFDEKLAYKRRVEKLENEPDYCASQISKYKMLMLDNVKSRLPDYYIDYCKFLKSTGSRDFVDMLTETLKLADSKMWDDNFHKKYDYVFVDEYQDTSSLQMQILLKLKAKVYHLIGDRNQSIYGFSGSNCYVIEKLLKQDRPTVEYSLSKNFRSDLSIVENSNKYSSLQAVAESEKSGKVEMGLIDEYDVIKMIKQDQDVVMLVRTNQVIRQLEEKFLLKKLPIRYQSIFTSDEIEIIRKRTGVTPQLNSKLKRILPNFGKPSELLAFLDENAESKSFITTIHKSKGREFPRCVVVNCLSPEIIEYNALDLNNKELKALSFDPGDIQDEEAKNVHYVAVTRPKNELYFMIYNENID